MWGIEMRPGWVAASRLVRRTIEEFVNDDGPLVAAGLAFYAILSLAPLLVLIVLVAGPLIGEAVVRAEVMEQAQRLAGQRVASTVERMLSGARRPSIDSVSAVVSIAILLFGATRVFAHLQRALNKVWDMKVVTQGLKRGLWNVTRKRLLSAGMILTVVVLLLVSLLAGTTLEIVSDFLPSMRSARGVYRALDLLATFALATALFAAVFKFLPDARIVFRDVWIGSMVTAALFVAGKFLIGLYLAHQSFGSSFGAASSVILLLLWVYYCCTIFLLGAEFTEVFAKLHGSGIHPEDHAVRVVRRHHDAASGEEG